jgi:hypothetical protein
MIILINMKLTRSVTACVAIKGVSDAPFNTVDAFHTFPTVITRGQFDVFVFKTERYNTVQRGHRLTPECMQRWGLVQAAPFRMPGTGHPPKQRCEPRAGALDVAEETNGVPIGLYQTPLTEELS